MLNDFTGADQVYIACGYTDLRKGIDGLARFVQYYADYLAKVNATMHLNHKPGEVMQVDWAGDTAAVIDTNTGEIIPAYVFVACC